MCVGMCVCSKGKGCQFSADLLLKQHRFPSQEMTRLSRLFCRKREEKAKLAGLSSVNTHSELISLNHSNFQNEKKDVEGCFCFRHQIWNNGKYFDTSISTSLLP